VRVPAIQSQEVPEMSYDSEYTSSPQKRDVIKVGMSGHSKELSMEEIALFNRKMNEFFRRRGLPSGEGFRGIISTEVKNAHKRRAAAENKAKNSAGQTKSVRSKSKTQRKAKKK
jgi:hypothetical protein